MTSHDSAETDHTRSDARNAADGRLHWVDIRHDPEGAAVVRADTGGGETVPTVRVAGRPHVDPDPARVREQSARSR
ncbi:hypothetical protein ACFVOR_26640 [Streptomyces sp. NPDC057837]|uniref:hypothetical protein n=1 Tax=Streptomyces sp. NPDC057837 TaxID=3346260 RepID=UPI00368B9BB7